MINDKPQQLSDISTNSNFKALEGECLVVSNTDLIFVFNNQNYNGKLSITNFRFHFKSDVNCKHQI